MSTGSKKSPTKQLQIVVLALLLALLSFVLGLHWHGIVGPKLIERGDIKKLFCYGDTNFLETFQLNCYSPLPKPFQGLKDHMTCRGLTNHQMTNSGNQFPTYNEFTSVKADYVSFTLDLDRKKSQIAQSLQPGEPVKEPYKVIQDDEHNVQAVRTVELDEFFGKVYEYLTLSKKTGKGMIVWTNTDDNSPLGDSIASTFIQCD